jgi:arylsulfatase A-like enzyme
VSRFERYVLDPLKERKILEDTLIIFLSDYDEQIGEFGHCGQSIPAIPEVVYVPTTFIHPDLDEKVKGDVFRHIDLPNTIGELINVDPPSTTDGTSVFNSSPEQGLSLINRTFPSFIGSFDYEIRSIWDKTEDM